MALPIDVNRGAEGVVRGVPLEVLDAGPVPNVFLARNPTEYVVPFVSPERDNGELVDAGLLAIQVDPPSVEYS